MLLISLVIFAYLAICMSLICRKMGFSPAIGLVTFRALSQLPDLPGAALVHGLCQMAALAR